MTLADPGPAARCSLPARRVWAGYGLAVLGCFGLLLLVPPAVPGLRVAGVGAAVFLAVTLGLAMLMRRHFTLPVFGACNTVTLLRAALTCLLLSQIGAEDWAVLVVAGLALALDGADGWLARRSGLTSGFGARFDMETDAALALVLAAHALVDGLAGPVVLLLGLMRYIFVAAALVWPWLGQPLPERFGRKLVCVVQIAALILLQWPGLTPGLAQGIAVAATLALLWSFGRDVLWLWRRA